MFYKKHISFLIICLIFSLLLSGCRDTVDYSSSPVIPGGEDLTHSEVSSDDTSSDVVSSEPTESSEVSSETPLKPVDPPVSSTAPHLHAFKITRVEPTCTKEGYTLYECSCGETKIDDYVPKKGHTFGEWKTVTEPTATAVGLKERTCTVCGEKETEQIPIVYAYSALSKEVFELVNNERANAGLPALAYRQDLQICVNISAEEIMEKFDQIRPNNTDSFTVLTENNIEYSATGENIDEGQSTPQAVMERWMNSDGHKENILSDSFTGIAIGVTEKDGSYYWVQIFIG